MKKRLIVFAVLAAIVSAMCLCFVACGETDGGAQSGYVVTFYGADGETVLKTVRVEEGKTAEDWTPESTGGATFSGWYATPTFTHAFDFDEPITKDTPVFSMWSDATPDTRTWQIAGQFAGKELKDNNWGEDGRLNVNKYKLAPVAGKLNTFTVTVDLYDGDKFQFAVFEYVKGGGDTYTRDWLNQKGYGLLDKNEPNFVNGGNYLSSVINKEDIVCKVDGKYKFTVVTDVKSDDVGRITWERLGDAAALEVEFTPAVMGTFNGYTCGTAIDPAFLMKKTDEDGLAWTLDVSLNVGDLMILVPLNNYTVQVTAGLVDKTSEGVKSNGHEIEFTETAEFTIALNITAGESNTFTYSVHIAKKGEYKTNAKENKYTVEYRSAAEGANYTVYLKNGARFPNFVAPTLAEGEALMGWHLTGAGEGGKNVGIETEAAYTADGTAGGKIGYGVTKAGERDTRAFWLKGTGGYANDEKLEWLNKKVYLEQTGDHEYTAILDLAGQVMEMQVCEDYLGVKTGKYFRNGSIADHKNLSFIDQNALSNIAFKTEGMYKLTLNSLTGVITVVEYED